MDKNVKNTKINVTETENGTYIIRMADFYPGYNGETEFQEVSKEIYDYLITDNRREKRELRRDWLHVSKYPFDEIIMGEMDGIFEEGPDSIMISKYKYNALYKAILQLEPVARRRLIFYYFKDKSKSTIADIEGISRSAVTQSINATLDQLRELIKVRDII